MAPIQNDARQNCRAGVYFQARVITPWAAKAIPVFAANNTSPNMPHARINALTQLYGSYLALVLGFFEAFLSPAAPPGLFSFMA